MSCGSGCGCCPKCGCRATCTCNQSLCFDETMADLSYNVITVMAADSGKLSGAKCACSSGTTDGFAMGFFSSEAAAYSIYYG